MQWLELHNMEFGECIVIGGADNTILMTDCGSMNHKLRETGSDVADYVRHSLMARYAGKRHKAFLLTHFHRDHMSGLREILRLRPQYFDTILLPAAPANVKGRALLLEFAIYVFAFLGRQSEYSQMSVSALRIFERLRAITGQGAVSTVGRGDAFSFDGVTYDVLWPKREEYPYSGLFTDTVEQLDVCLSSPFLGENAPLFLRLKKEFCAEYLRCCTLCAIGRKRDAQAVEASINKLRCLLDEIEELSTSLLLLPTAPDVVDILNAPSVRAEYSFMQNMASVVYQNRRTSAGSYNDILMTGDATPETFDEIAEDLYDGYYIFKAPHHGTQGSWSDRFYDIAKTHILISNGDYHAGGMICENYPADEGIKHCTNPSACVWMQERGGCCNRTSFCWEAGPHGLLTLRCPMCAGQKRRNGCGIYVVSHRGDRGCFCDMQGIGYESDG
ncbi:MAG TPA: MBL fold metallo-hydrolase [Candidatus Gallacutalibacter stercoravium]|nr:MBL fold metallo-hydrolase [Candidatus Gallacutalibacter stercoravium]